MNLLEYRITTIHLCKEICKSKSMTEPHTFEIMYTSTCPIAMEVI